MYIDTWQKKNKNGSIYVRRLLRTSYRDKNGKVQHKTILNLKNLSQKESEAIKLVIESKGEVVSLKDLDIEIKQGKSIGSVHLLKGIANELSITKALGNSKQGKLALWQIIARIIDQGSRLSASKLLNSYDGNSVLALDRVSEDVLYKNLDWLADTQIEIENKLYNLSKNKDNLYLYDVTSSYFEGQQNELASFGYNRDKKSGKKQIVVGLLCNSDGVPLSIDVFKGNTNDLKTFSSQCDKLKKRFKAKNVTMVGDRGMIKGPQIEELEDNNFTYVTAITKAQIKKLADSEQIQTDLFDEDLKEVSIDKKRYIVRRNPQRAKSIKITRDNKYENLNAFVEKKNEYLNEHERARPEVALKHCLDKAIKLRIDKWAKLHIDGRIIKLSKDDLLLKEESSFDGCYVITTNLRKEEASKNEVHDAYKLLLKVEKGFRTMKTSHLELRPINVRLKRRTIAHTFVVMLAYKIVKELEKRWRDLDITVEKGIDLLSKLCFQSVYVKDKLVDIKIPQPSDEQKLLFEKANIKLPRNSKATRKSK